MRCAPDSISLPCVPPPPASPQVAAGVLPGAFDTFGSARLNELGPSHASQPEAAVHSNKSHHGNSPMSIQGSSQTASATGSLFNRELSAADERAGTTPAWHTAALNILPERR
jgi:hypothetical protein